MRLRALGNTGRYLAAASGGSSYLVETGATRILLDAGGGARDALARLGAPRLDVVVLSHFHFDHVLDFVTLGALADEGTRVFVPPGESERFQLLAKAYAFRGSWDIDGLEEVAFGKRTRVGDAELSFAPTRHSAPSMATRVDAGDALLVYASDTAPCDTLRVLAHEADLLVMHALLPTVEEGSHHAEVHATAASAGAFAATSTARRLLLSHRYHESRDEEMLAAATRWFRHVELARDDAVYGIGEK